MFKPARALLFASLTALLAASSPSVSSPGERHLSLPSSGQPDLPLSVMTYNVMGLPWPIAFGRDEALGRIADRLAGLRAERRQPHIVLIQEGFTADPAQFAQRAGYAHVAAGPDPAMRSAIVATAADRIYLRSARWDRGETLDKPLNSGLIILSDYPIEAVDRIAYPAFACAGFDCLANKGAMIAHLRVPGFDRPVAVVNTHLNARKAAGVSIARSLRAFDRQAGLLAGFVARHVPRDRTLLLGGDLNIGGDAQRIGAFFTHWNRPGLTFVAPLLGGGRQAKAQALLADPADRRDLDEAVLRSKDWIFARSATGAPMSVTAAHIPFGGPADQRLSDHVGYAIGYEPAEEMPLRFADAGGR
ncbi:endonuclease/exonuclease/phosphatase family protein [Sphingobium sp. WCS2017Hpa-17]|uniref:endonuclease/exonuclease/phosphatase family protein n=1 Tax=Sphingobium sp. WCS2017Hpa-17 TaxID=3073638 RepID=UPI00288AA983|nr:endonuclease/exonuclease/phosphatase family protein [Sphingobium sp. WCS2017Hpa-17]